MEALLPACLHEHALAGLLLEMETVFFSLTFNYISNPMVLTLLCSSTVLTLEKGSQIYHLNEVFKTAETEFYVYSTF